MSDQAYAILKNLKEWDLKSLDEQGTMCVRAGNYIAKDPNFVTSLKRFVEWYNNKFAN